MNKEQNFWNQRYLNAETPWDIGQASPALMHYLKDVPKDQRILFPGAGRAYEAVALFRQGYEHIYVCDWATAAFDWIKQQTPEFPSTQLLVNNFFDLNLEVDLIMEQTFFCAIQPDLRPQYVKKTHELLSHQGKVAGLFFAKPFPFQGPPFGGTQEEYQALFEPHFKILQLALSPHSIQPRLGNELFFEFKKIS